MLASASHPNIISIFDFGSSDGLIYVVMELLDGHTLRALLGDGRCRFAGLLDYAIQIAQGLGQPTTAASFIAISSPRTCS